ncbi:MAG: hypothetical protein AAFX96_09205, partial [Pseudomonadota bacterium]
MANEDFDEAVRQTEKFTPELVTASKSLREELGSKARGQDGSCDIMIVAHDPERLDKRLLQLCCDATDVFSQIYLVSSSQNEFFAALFTEMQLPKKPQAERFKLLCLGGNFGPSVARNVVSIISDSEYTICIDDDGITDLNSLQALLNTARDMDAECVRGVIYSKTEGSEIPEHYNKSRSLNYSYCDIEGMTIWRNNTVEKYLFNSIIYGHEGTELTFRMFEQFAPEAFLIEPEAVLYHDFYKPGIDREEKIHRGSLNYRFVRFLNPNYTRHKEFFGAASTHPQRAQYLASRKNMLASYGNAKSSGINDTQTKFTLITACTNKNADIATYANALNSQNAGGFDTVFVNASDNARITDEVNRRLPGLNVITIEPGTSSRSDALNIAIENRKSDWCIIADVEGLCLPDRIKFADHIVSQHSQMNIFSFNEFS